MFLPQQDEWKLGMRVGNGTVVTEFILKGFSGLDQKLQLFLCLVLLLMYLTTVMGNAAIIFLVCVDNRLQTPMYYFIGNLAFLEIWFTSSTSTKLLVILSSGRRTISVGSCFAQSSFYFALGAAEFVLLVVMSFDRYVAICQPLRYAAIMKHRLCIHLVAAVWVMGFTFLSYRLVLLSKLTFCGLSKIQHFFCDTTPLFQLSCSDVSLLWKTESVFILFIVLSSLCLTVASYTYLFLYSTNASSLCEEKSFCYMFLPSHHLGHCLWKLHCSLRTLLRSCFFGHQQHCSFAEHCPVPILKPIHLQS